MKARAKVLFILKRRLDYNGILHSAYGLSTGLFNSANYMVQMLRQNDVEAQLEVAIDNNCIDRMVTKYKPTHVILEALWVVPSKLEILTKLHPSVHWIIRLHSEMPFIASEGIAMDWVGEYIKYPQVTIGVNAPRMLDEIRTFLSFKIHDVKRRVVYMPNYYPQFYNCKRHNRGSHIDIACFGAIRPLKNHLLQAISALKFAKQIHKKLRFHINTGRIEMKGEPVKNNLEALFKQIENSGHKLIKHEWTPKKEFSGICAKMDIGMQCNFSETFNIVSADLISAGVPIVGSKEIPWSSRWFNADPSSSEDIVKMLHRAYNHPYINVCLNQHNLTAYTNKSEKIWLRLFK